MIKKMMSTMVLLAALVSLRAAVPPVKEAASTETAVAKTTTYHGLKEMAENIKGEKLNLREKISLTVAAKVMKVAEKKAIKRANWDGDKSQTTAIILCALLGGLGIHRFYLGYTLIGIIQLLTLGGLGIWSLIDLIRICTGSLEPKDGSYS